MIKKAIYSNWSKPNDSNFAGFNNDEAFADSLHLSVLCAKKWFEEVELITDTKGKKLIDKYKIPFDNVVVCLDDYNHIRAEHWSIGKMVACCMQKSPFMHIDNDVFWFKKPQERLLRADCSFQNYENADYFGYKYQRPPAIETCPIKEIDYTETKALNCGIIGFNKLDVLPEWMELALRYIEWFDNNTKLRDWCKLAPIMFEQYHIYQLVKKNNYDISVISYDYATSVIDTRKKMINDSLAEEYGYTHLISGIKREKHVEEKVKARLIREIQNAKERKEFS
jgi:hypothetical protein